MSDTIIVQPNIMQVEVTAPGPQGPAGEGVPNGGTAGQVLTKVSDISFDTEWQTPGAITVSYLYTQGMPSDVWNIDHNLGWNPNVTVQDSAGTTVEGDVVYHNINSLSVTFVSAFAGIAYLS